MKFTEDQIEDIIHTWHDGGGGEGIEVYEYLGWSWDQYKAWLSKPDAAPEIPDNAPCIKDLV